LNASSDFVTKGAWPHDILSDICLLPVCQPPRGNGSNNDDFKVRRSKCEHEVIFCFFQDFCEVCVLHNVRKKGNASIPANEARLHLPLSLQVTLVAHQQEDDAVRLHVAAGLLQPVVDVLEGAAVGDVEEEEAAHGVAVVSPGDGPAEGGGEGHGEDIERGRKRPPFAPSMTRTPCPLLSITVSPAPKASPALRSV